MKRWCLVFGLGLLTGCSFSLGGPDPARPRLQKPTCDTEKNLVVIDGLLATTGAITTLALAADHDAVAVLPAVLAAVFLGAAIHGSHAVDACRNDNERYLAEKATPVGEPDRVANVPPLTRPVLAVRPVAPVAAPIATPTARDPWADFWRVVQ